MGLENVFKKLVFSFGGLLLSFFTYGQILNPHNILFYNNGDVYIDSGVVVQIYGNTISTGPNSILQNNGLMYVHFDSIFLAAQKGFTLDNNTFVIANGYFEIEPHWTCNTPYFNGENLVNLMSDNEQLITGSEVTTFYQLQLSGDGATGTDRIKRMTLNTEVIDSLALNNRELAADSFTVFVFNTETTSISRSSTSGDIGFISSLKGDTREGFLQRRTANSQTPYLFPMGSSVNPPGSDPYIYRPVDILPKNNNINAYQVRFAHESPDLAGYDQFSLSDSLCSVNPHFYHIINHPSGFDPARIRIFYDPLQDDVYDYIAQWGQGQWNLNKSTTFGTGGALFNAVIPELQTFSRDSLPFILADRIPGKPDVLGDDGVCSNGLAMLIAKGNSKFYDWKIPAEMELLSDQGDDTLIIKVTTESGYIQLSATSSTGKCVEAADSFLLVVNPGPTANFTASINSGYTGENIEFKDSTLGSPVEWFWNFGDGSTAASPLVKHRFENVGTYSVEMYVKDENGCIDSSLKIINILEGISVPNVFTPNGDGKNDFFYIPNSGIKEYHLQIFNRWGAIMFETRAPEIAWDGRNNFGQECAEGNYYYILEAVGDEEEYLFKGFLTLLR